MRATNHSSLSPISPAPSTVVALNATAPETSLEKTSQGTSQEAALVDGVAPQMFQPAAAQAPAAQPTHVVTLEHSTPDVTVRSSNSSMTTTPSLDDITRLAKDGPLEALLELLQQAHLDLSVVESPLICHVISQLWKSLPPENPHPAFRSEVLRCARDAIITERNAAMTPLILPIIQRLIALGASVDVPNADNDKAVAIAFYCKNEALLECLFEAGADVNHPLPNGTYLLESACEEGCTSLVALLLKHDANPNVSTPHRPSLLHRACQAGNPEIVECLLNCGALLDAQFGHTGDTPLMWACAAGQEAVVKLLLNNCPSQIIQQPNYQQETALTIALRYPWMGIIRQLLAAEVSIDGFDMRSHVLKVLATDPQMIVLWRTKLALVLEHIDDINETNGAGQSLLMLLLPTRNPDLIKALLNRGANPLHKDMLGLTATDIARGLNCQRLVNVLEAAIRKLYAPSTTPGSNSSDH